jgi:hypothetical protein|tara:strand:- start:40 stop:261 length:222 start_codon:yes stop_codon:yes gene_type:complete
MNIQTEKIELAKLLLNTNDPEIIQSIKKILKKETSPDFWEELNAEQKQEIKDARKEIENGNYTDYEVFISKHK